MFNFLKNFLIFVGEIGLLFQAIVKRFFKKPIELEEILNQMAFVGVSTVPVVMLTTFFSGAVIGLYLSEILIKYGATKFIGLSLGLSITREVAPVLAGVTVTARCGSAMAAQIGSMVVTEQVDALKSLNVNPINYLVIPRFVASIVTVPILTLLGIYTGVLGGYVVSIDQGVISSVFIDSIRSSLKLKDVTNAMIKGSIFGMIIALVACQQGLRTKRGAAGVGLSTTNTVVIAMVLIYMFNFLISNLIYSY